MFAYLRGIIQYKEMTGTATDRLVLDVGGIGYEIHTSHATLLRVGDIGEEITIFTSLVIRESDWTIFGFRNQDEKAIFEILQSVSGVGPKVAMAIIATLSVKDLCQAVLDEDHKMISQAPGVGPKLAQRLVLELRSKIEAWQEKNGLALTLAAPTQTVGLNEVRDILEGLGYTPTEISMVLKKAQEENIGSEVEDLVRFSLKALGSAAKA
jgi:Holliday junction DNA helicase RuvA